MSIKVKKIVVVAIVVARFFNSNKILISELSKNYRVLAQIAVEILLWSLRNKRLQRIAGNSFKKNHKKTRSLLNGF